MRQGYFYFDLIKYFVYRVLANLLYIYLRFAQCNNWTEYIIGQHWNVIGDIVPEKSNHMLMDCMPGFIHSGDDFVITSNGILITETTITGFRGFNTAGIPEFQRADRILLAQDFINFILNMRGRQNT